MSREGFRRDQPALAEQLSSDQPGLAWIIACGILLGLPSSAQAQAGSASSRSRTELSIGYQVTHVPDITLPLGWAAQMGIPVANGLHVAVELSGAYKSETIGVVSGNRKLHTFMGGIQIDSRTDPNLVPFAEVLVGAARASGGVSIFGVSVGASDTEFAVQLGGGINVMASRAWGVKIGVDYRRISEVDENEFRGVLGVVFPLGR